MRVYGWLPLLLAASVCIIGCGKPAAERPAAGASRDTSEADRLFAKAKRFERGGAYDSALVYFRRAGELFERDGDRSRQVQMLNRQVQTLYSLYDVEAARALNEQVLSRTRVWFGERDSSYAVALVQSVWLQRRGDEGYGTSIRRLMEALSIFEATTGERHAYVSMAYHLLGTFYMERGDPGLAGSYLSKALEIRKAVRGPVHAEVASDLESVCKSYAALGDFEKALRYCEEMRGVATALGIPAVNAISYRNLGSVFYEKGDYERAIGVFQEGIRYHRSTIGTDGYWMTSLHYRLAQSYVESGTFVRDVVRRDSMFRALDRVLDELIRLFGSKDTRIATAHSYVARAYAALQRYDEALGAAQQALQVAFPTFSDDDPLVNPTVDQVPPAPESYLLDALRVKVEILLGFAGAAPGSALASLRSAREALLLQVELSKRIRQRTRDQRSAFELARQATAVAELSIHVLERLAALTGDARYVEEAFAFAERSKAFGLQRAHREAAARRSAGLSGALLDRETALRGEITKVDTRLATERLKGEAADLDSLTYWSAQLVDLHQRYDTLLAQVERAYPAYQELKDQTQPISIPKLQQFLSDARTALIEYVAGTDSTYAFVVTSRSVHLVTLPAAPDLGASIDALNAGIREDRYDDFVRLSRRLYRDLFEPLRPYLGDAAKLLVIPDGVLHRVPFEVLLAEEPDEAMRRGYRTLPYLLHHYEIRTHVSATMLVDQAAQQPIRPPNDLLAFAPVFDAGLPSDTRSGAFYRANVDSARADAGALVHSREEVEEIGRLFARGYGWWERWWGERSVLLLDGRARERRVKSAELASYRYLHFATHAFANEAEPVLAGLLLAEEDATAADDGILRLGEVYNLRLNADLVVLSACETGLGKTVRGEGSIGLAYGFLYAGARNVLMSLHRVPDAATKELMVAFYENVLAGAPMDAALRAAKLEMLARPSARPRDWAWFVLVGA